jgi:hypothetical protein
MRRYCSAYSVVKLGDEAVLNDLADHCSGLGS